MFLACPTLKPFRNALHQTVADVNQSGGSFMHIKARVIVHELAIHVLIFRSETLCVCGGHHYERLSS